MDPNPLIQAYLDDELSEAQFAELSAWLSQSEANREAFVQATNLDNNIRRELAQDDLSRFLGEVDIDALQHAMRQSPEDSATALLSITDAEIKFQDTKDEMTLSHVAGVLTRAGIDLVGQSLRRHAVALSLAAAVALAFVLAITLIGRGAEPTSPEVADQTPTTPEIEKANIVATLTATQNAQWAERDLSRGTPLHAGQRFTLTAGFAEITTHRGAVAIVEAPASIEFSNNDNAISLHAGKLVGICETDSSKGFIVSTPHMDILDLGTRFGVDATVSDATEVHVIAGSVRVDREQTPATAAVTMELTTGQAIAMGSQQVPIRVGLDVSRFTHDLLRTSLRPRIEGRNTLWMGQLAGDLTTGLREAAGLQLFVERQGLVLGEDVPVDLVAPMAWPPDEGFANYRVPAGSEVDVYLLHVDTPKAMEEQQLELAGACIIRFDRPILGVIAAGTTLVSTDAALGTPGSAYPSNVMDRDAIGLRGAEIGHHVDPIQIIEGGTAIRVELTAGFQPKHLDQIRVLVQAAEESIPEDPIP